MLATIHPLTSLSAPELPRSNQVFGALCWGLRAVAGDADLRAFLELCDAGDPPVLLSSGFPWSDVGGKRLRFLPRPRSAMRRAPLAWATFDLWKQLLAADDSSSEPPPALSPIGDRQCLPSELPDGPDGLPLPGSRRPLLSPMEMTVRRRGAAGLHGRCEMWFGAGAGWYFLAHVRKPEWEARIRGAIAWVCDTGWGGDRSIGKGLARVEFEPDFLPASQPDGSARCALLSLYHPTDAERIAVSAGLANSSCELVARDGVGHQGKPKLFVAEGSVLTLPAGAVAGSCIRLDPTDGESEPRRVWGFAYPVAL